MLCGRPGPHHTSRHSSLSLTPSSSAPRPFRAPPNPPPPPASVHTGARQSATPARRLPREPLLRGRLRRAPPFPVPSGGGLRAGRRSVRAWVDLSLVRNPKLARVDSSGSEFVPAICFKCCDPSNLNIPLSSSVTSGFSLLHNSALI